MTTKYIDIYNNLVKLTRNKVLYKNIVNNESFSDRLIIFFFHFAFFLKLFKKQTSKENLQDLYDYVFKQIELSIREIGYGDASVNKKMKEYVNLMYSIVDKVELWENLDLRSKYKFLSEFINTDKDSSFFSSYFDKYSIYLTKNSFNYFTKEVISLKF